METTGADLKAFRDEGGVLQQELAQALGMPTSTLSRIEGGWLPMPEGLPDLYRAAVRRIVRERAAAVGALDPEPAEVAA